MNEATGKRFNFQAPPGPEMGERALWAAVIEQAIEDRKRRKPGSFPMTMTEIASARTFFEFGYYRGVAFAIGIEPETVIKLAEIDGI